MIIRIRHFICIVITILFCSFTIPDTLTGTYWGPNKKSKLQFFKKDDNYYGKLIWTEDLEITDKNNSIINLRNRKLVGVNLFFSLKYNQYLKVWKGKFYDPISGENYLCDLWLTNTNKTLMARGYSEYSILSQTEALQRID